MKQPHIIRLRGPWQRQLIEGPDLPVKTITMPNSWAEDLGADFVGAVEYQRFFNCPTGIDEATSIQLAFTEIKGQATIWLNSEQLPTTDIAPVVSCDVTGQLKRRNELRVQIVAIGEPDGGMVGEVQLKIG